MVAPSRYKRKKKIMVEKYFEQEGRCCYCKGYPILERVEKILEGKRRCRVAAAPLKSYLDCCASFEHIIRQTDGGTDDPQNASMACQFCNKKRNDALPQHHGIAMQLRMRNGTHPLYRVPPPERLAEWLNARKRTLEIENAKNAESPAEACSGQAG